ncbi:MAG TPA: M14 family zinc carboxypeptidase, partial [Rhizobacter sp.]|nr:M14 family zinc carboxypeptidase [Rhizobacter sp.]
MTEAFAGAMRRWLAPLGVAVVAACSSSPPPKTSPAALPAPAGPRPPASAPSAARPAAPAASAASAASAAATPAAAPVQSDAMAARFPEPAVAYRVPALQEGRSSFTSQDELQSLLRGLAGDPSTGARLVGTGTSQAGVPLEALLFTREADASGAALQRSGRPTVLLIGQQHGDEPAGSEALLVVAQELARGKLQPLLDRINVVLLPRANPDGSASGRHATANGIDIDHDQLLLGSPEGQALARLLREYQPAVVVDAQEYPVGGSYQQKFGAVQRHDAWLQYATTANLPAFVTKAAEEWFRQPLLTGLKQQGLSAEW